MYMSKGRSGIGDTNIQGTWEDWCGLSMNGRQYRNAITQETRNLSGSEYWNARRADYPKQEPEVWKNGMANIKAFGDPVTTATKTPTKPKLTAFDKICTADRAYSRLSDLSEELDNQLEGGEIDLESWAYARKQLDKKLEKAWSAVCRLRNWNESGESLDNHLDSGLTFSLDDVQEARDIGEKQHVKRELTGWGTIDDLSEENCFRGLFCKVKRVMMFVQKVNAAIKETF